MTDMMNERIPAEKFAFVQENERLLLLPFSGSNLGTGMSPKVRVRPDGALRMVASETIKYPGRIRASI